VTNDGRRLLSTRTPSSLVTSVPQRFFLFGKRFFFLFGVVLLLRRGCDT
jgi:hypothetical protein